MLYRDGIEVENRGPRSTHIARINGQAYQIDVFENWVCSRCRVPKKSLVFLRWSRFFGLCFDCLKEIQSISDKQLQDMKEGL